MRTYVVTFQMGFLGDLAKNIALNSEQSECLPNKTHPLGSHYIYIIIYLFIFIHIYYSYLLFNQHNRGTGTH